MHLFIHLVYEIKLGGLVHCLCMFSIEEDLCKLKSFVRNRSRLEGSIAEGYLVKEYLTFCSRFMLDGAKTRFSRYGINDDMVEKNDEASPIFPKIGHLIIGKKRNKCKKFTLEHQSLAQAHHYALFNCGNELVDKYIK